MTLEISKILTLSTAHITEATAKLMEHHCRRDEYGFFMSTHYVRWPSEDLVEVLKFARANGCDYVNLDRDGPVVDELPVYDW